MACASRGGRRAWCSNAGFHSGARFTAVQCCEAVPGRSPESGKCIHKSPREPCHGLSPCFSHPATRPNAALWNALPMSPAQWLPWPKPLGPRGSPDTDWLAWSSVTTAPFRMSHVHHLPICPEAPSLRGCSCPWLCVSVESNAPMLPLGTIMTETHLKCQQAGCGGR